MLDDPRAVEAEPVGELDLFEGFGEHPLLVAVVPRPGYLVLEEQPELHRAPQSGCRLMHRHHDGTGGRGGR